MLLNKMRIHELGLIQNDDPAQYRSAGYDVRIGTIINSSGVDMGDTFLIAPRGTVEVISTERIILPKHVMGYAFIRTTLCNKGILALNMGLIDPAYEGLLSTTLLNFSKNEFVINVGEPFLRLTFHEHDPIPASISPTGMSDEEYVRVRKEYVSTYFGSSFLDIEDLTESMVERSMQRVTKYLNNKALIVIAGLGLLLPLFIIVMNLAINAGALWTGTLTPIFDIASERIEKQIDPIVARQDQLGGKVDNLESQLDLRVRELENRLRNIESRVGNSDSRN